MKIFEEVFKEEVSLRTKAVHDVEMHRVCAVCTCVYCVVRSCNGVWCEVCTVCAV